MLPVSSINFNQKSNQKSNSYPSFRAATIKNLGVLEVCLNKAKVDTGKHSPFARFSSLLVSKLVGVTHTTADGEAKNIAIILNDIGPNKFDVVSYLEDAQTHLPGRSVLDLADSIAKKDGEQIVKALDGATTSSINNLEAGFLSPVKGA